MTIFAWQNINVGQSAQKLELSISYELYANDCGDGYLYSHLVMVEHVALYASIVPPVDDVHKLIDEGSSSQGW